MEEFGYIYIREHEAYSKYNACKLGKTESIPERDNTYITGEIVRGVFTLIFEVKKEQLDNIEKELQEEFKNLNIYNNGGTEFFKIEIKELIEPYFKEKNIYYKILSEEDIKSLKRKYREKKLKEICIQEQPNIILENELEYNKYLQQVKINSLNIKNVPEEFKIFELCIEAIRNFNPDCDDDILLDFIPDNIKNYNFWLECVRIMSMYLTKVPENLIDYNIIFTAFKTDNIKLDYKIENFKSLELCIEAIKNNMNYLNFLSEKILNYDLCLEAVKLNNCDLSDIPKKFITQELCLEAIKNNSSITNLEYVPKEFKTYELYLEAIKNYSDRYENEYIGGKINVGLYCFIQESIKNNCEILKIIPEEFKTYELCLKIVKNLLKCHTQQYPTIYKYIPKSLMNFFNSKTLKNNYNFLKELGKKYPVILINRNLCKIEYYLEIVKYNGSALFIVPWEKRNYEICLEAVKNYGFAIECVPEEIMTLELCLIAIEEGSTVLSFIPDKFKTDELCFEAVKIGGEYALKCLPDNFKTKEFYNKCIEYDNKLAQYIPKKFKKNICI